MGFEPKDEPVPGNIKVTRADWINLALQTLISDGIESVRVLTLGQKLGVSRSSFYWYFESRQDLLDQLGEIPSVQAAALGGALALSEAQGVGRLYVGAATLSLLAGDADVRYLV